MPLTQRQKQITDTFFANLIRDNINQDAHYLMLKFSEEAGELVQSFLVHTKQCRPEKHVEKSISKKEMAKEMADVFGLLFAIATIHNIDIEEALDKKRLSRERVARK